MQTFLFVLAGFFFLGVSLALVRWRRISLPLAMQAYIVGWFVIAAGNFGFGVAVAGHAIGEELPVFIAVFLVPVSVALLIRAKHH